LKYKIIIRHPSVDVKRCNGSVQEWPLRSSLNPIELRKIDTIHFNVLLHPLNLTWHAWMWLFPTLMLMKGNHQIINLKILGIGGGVPKTHSFVGRHRPKWYKISLVVHCAIPSSNKIWF
jgi:hypothetical protein